MKKIAVLGSGLLGGSMALAGQKRLPDTEVYLWGRRQASVDEAASMGIQHATTSLTEAVKGADLLILSTPVGAMLQILETVSRDVSLKGMIITDVGSVKLTPRETLDALVRRCEAKYIGSHPMAGSEQTGVLAARESLFDGAACVMTNDFGHDEADVDALKDFWLVLGCRCYLTSSEDHDAVMARISHLPHLLASVGAMVGLKDPDYGKFAGNGMRDTTRVASGHPGMWAEIMLRNRESLKAPIEESIEHLREMLALLEQSSEEAVTSFLQQAKDLRDQLPPKKEQ
ncbi:prephenate dehydrogenase/arogenate dehydrogenase family protein [Verrucomicrobiaceae bacterium N1E253]|uniref:Prephenate dehydrogenase/arogenate dehydrogenase family protein n=1 Tax=Oceaniferula marina TaxID=2748318 RepID=A0A851GBN7_9BACT|nr:prephenate dehydrogenase/arogenate dehydrogenase family protein [Oceaniferula marina]NWK54352.1 prephenate dehydrogenase/arogenate dehydrogenase family protein [Oceaniferula marina]